MRFHIDALNQWEAKGWAISDDGLPAQIDVYCDDELIISTIADDPRPDVGAAHQQDRSGFSIDLPTLSKKQVGILSVKINGALVGKSGYIAAPIDIKSKPINPISEFPRDITALLSELCPTDHQNWHQRIIELSRYQGTHHIKSLTEYIRYLRAVWHHIQFVKKYFPAVNEGAVPADKDFASRPNHPESILSIAHQLYVLKSYNLYGDFAEFGCFKGFSTSMLSYACNLLDIKMHVFDSFEGLPESDSRYYRAGDFRGSLDEVKANVSQFGCINSLSFHKGFFCDSIPALKIKPPLICIWMDVDLETSSRDVMKIADALDPKGTIFSHECQPSNFEQGSIIPIKSADGVITPILERFNDMHADLTGKFVYGDTGSFWRRHIGFPVLENTKLCYMVQEL